jgi:hypothetical protein
MVIGYAFRRPIRYQIKRAKELAPLPKMVSARYGCRILIFAKDGISTLWLSHSDSDAESVQLTLKSKKTMASEYFSYRIDNIDTLTIRSAIKGCESNCLTESVPKKGAFIKTLKRALRIQFEYDSYPQITQNPTFSLRGFTKAYNWLVRK